MTANEILQKIHNSKALKKILATAKVGLKCDLKQELFLALLEKEQKENGWICKAHDEGWIDWWLIRTSVQMQYGNRSPFMKKFAVKEIIQSEDLPEIIDIEEIEDIEEKERVLEFIEKQKETLSWYEKEILHLYCEGVPISQLANETGIPRRSIYKTIEKVTKKIKANYDNSNSFNNLH